MAPSLGAPVLNPSLHLTQTPKKLSPSRPPPCRRRPPLRISGHRIVAVNSTTRNRETPQVPTLHDTISSLCSRGNLRDALHLLQPAILSSPLPPQVSDSVSTLLQACGQESDLETGRELHLLMSTSRDLMSNAILTTRLITMYAMCGSPADSALVFEALEDRNLFQWNAFISACTRNELWDEALEVFCRLMRTETCLRPDNFTLPCVLKACGGISDIRTGESIHAVVFKFGLSSDSYVCNSLVSMYGRCGYLDSATRVFDLMLGRNLVSWNTLMIVLSENGLAQECLDAFREMLRAEECAVLDDATVVTLLPVCAAEGWIEMGMLIHGLAVKSGLVHELRVKNALMDVYAKGGFILEAEQLFLTNFFQNNIVSWNVMIGGSARSGDVPRTVGLLSRMISDGMKANELTILNTLPVFLETSELLFLMEIHGYTIRNGLQSNSLVDNALIAAYAKCGSLGSAFNIFYGIRAKTVDAWNALIGGCAQNGEPTRAVDLFLQMESSNIKPDWFSIGSLLLACSNLRYITGAKSIHCYMLRNGLEIDQFLLVSLLSLYIQCGKPSLSKILFDRMEMKSVVSWNVMISGFSQCVFPEESLQLFRDMQRYGNQPSEIALTSAFAACSQVSALRLGKETHSYALKADVINDPFIGSSIMDMYAKCGSLELSRRFFDRLKRKDVVSWTVMVTGCGLHGFGFEAIKLFERMESEGIIPDSFTYMGVLMSCSHAGLVEEGLRYFREMRNKHGLVPKVEHYACMVDMMGRAGRLVDARSFIEEMPEDPDGTIWGALLAACRIHGDAMLGEEVAKKLLELEPEKPEHYVLASNLFASSGRWEDVRSVRKTMKEMTLRKEPGCSWMEVGGKLYKFIAGDNRLPQSCEIKKMWDTLEDKIRLIGYVPDTNSVMHELEYEEKVTVLRGHSEKQAIAFGLLQTSHGTTLRVCKNVRMCQDCHNAVKLVSEVTEREIVMRDNKRFHHFKDGVCSCRDYW